MDISIVWNLGGQLVLCHCSLPNFTINSSSSKSANAVSPTDAFCDLTHILSAAFPAFLKVHYLPLSCVCCTTCGNTPQARTHISWLFPDHFQIPWLFFYCAGNILWCIRPTVGIYIRHTSFCRRDVLCIGHTRLTHSCWLAATSLSVWLVNVHLLSSTFSLNVLILETFATNILSLPLWKMYLNKLVCVMS